MFLVIMEGMMNKIAIPHHLGYVSPVFDVARNILIHYADLLRKFYRMPFKGASGRTVHHARFRRTPSVQKGVREKRPIATFSH
jgi:hypothetical protein